MTRDASCRCGQVRITCTGEPTRVSVCHCSNCKRRSGSAFAAQARFERGGVTIVGEMRTYESISDSGNRARFHFCPECGGTAFYETQAETDLIAVPIGNFADPAALPAPLYSVYETRKLGWVEIVGDGIDHID